ncbi:MAG: uroporphyrinogen-III C-methyltransferase [Betaproteobacteria bacterium]|nr:uroporphyrinogen-III C-methyltransferase [Betaproteobacteria bacterium]
MDQLPAFMNVRGANALVAGGTDAASRKVELLLRAGATVTVYAAQLCPLLADMAKTRVIEHRARHPEADEVAAAALVFAADPEAAVNREVARWARASRVPVCVLGDPEASSFVVPVVIDRSPMVIAISSGGASPVLTRLLRMRLEALIPAGFGRLAAFAAQFRDRARKRIADYGQRRKFWEEVLSGAIAEKVFSGQEASARAALEAALEAAQSAQQARGEVYLVGAGPGNPDLMTFRALRLMQQADVVLHDNLVGDGILELVHADAERIYVGKERGHHALPQEEINTLMVRLALAGKRVLRLKGGDPFMFGRGGEEIETLVEYGIPFEVVPGITSAAGAACYAGIPLTHRDYAQSCTFVTGHKRDFTSDLDWPGLVRPNQTVVIYMGLARLEEIARELIAHGRASQTPAAVVEQATTARQRVLTGTLATLPALATASGIRSPALIIIGEVVTLHGKLNWFNEARVKDVIASPQSVSGKAGIRG